MTGAGPSGARPGPVAALEIITMPNGAFQENCYLVGVPGYPDAVLVDPGDEPDRFLAEAEHRGYQIAAIWLTHAHLDHIQGVGEVHRATGAPIFLHPADLDLYRNLPQQGLLFGLRLEPPPPAEPRLAQGQQLSVGGVGFEVRHAPGHTPGHVVFVGGGAVLGGDVLFQGSIGRSDLPGGNAELLLASIRRELLTLPDETIVYPGHGPDTTIGRERVTNPFLTGSV